MAHSVNLARLKKHQADVMDDKCVIYHVSFSSGTYSTKATETRTLFASGVACGVKFTNNQVVQHGQAMFVEYDAVLRVSSDRPIAMTDEILLVEKGEFVISGTFKPFSQPVVNSTVQKIQLKRVVP